MTLYLLTPLPSLKGPKNRANWVSPMRANYLTMAVYSPFPDPVKLVGSLVPGFVRACTHALCHRVVHLNYLPLLPVYSSTPSQISVD